MATRYALVDETDGIPSTVLVEEGAIWEEQQGHEDTSTYENASNITLTENMNDSYMTANEEENETQYFSVLEASNADILNDTLSNNKSQSGDSNTMMNEEEVNDDNTVDIAGQQVVLFKVGDSEELYGIQLAQDEEGNIQKYQFKIRHNDEGNLEAVPETIQILPLDSEVPMVDPEDPEDTNEESDDGNDTIVNEEIFIKQELPADSLTRYCDENGEQEEANMDLYRQTEFTDYQGNTLVNYQEEEEENNMDYQESNNLVEGALEESIDCKEGLLEQLTIDNKKMLNSEITISQESDQQHQAEIDNDEKAVKEQQQMIIINHQGMPSDEFSKQYEEGVLQQNVAEEEEEMETANSYEQLFLKDNSMAKNIKPEPIETTVDLEHLFADAEDGENSQESQQSHILVPAVNENESDTDYQIVEGLHITGDAEVTESFQTFDEAIRNQTITYSSQNQKVLPLHTHVLKIQQPTLSNRKMINFKNFKIRKIINSADNNKKEGTYFVTKHPEKENLDEVARLKAGLMKTGNPRSLLKTSHPSFVESRDIKSDEKFEKRFAKSKEAIQARQFHNFIAQTKIIHAPVRSQRLPRKQKINPVVRTDEEIIVQEVVVSSNGYIETSEDGVVLERVPLKPTEFIQLSDSDDDYDPKKVVKRKKKNKKRKSIVEITITDSEEEESDYETINLDSEGNESDVDTKTLAKVKNAETNKSTENSDDLEVKEKRKRGRPPKVKVDAAASSNLDLDKKLEIQCEKCTKTFPSQGSLKTHMQFHTFKEANKRKLQTNINTFKPDYKYKCAECGETFKNGILLTRHMANHKKFVCTICKKVYFNQNEFTAHKRTHLKQQLCLTTSTVKVSPMKMKTRISTALKRTRSPIKKVFTCPDCKRVLDSKQAYDVHVSKHRRFPCKTCGTSFLSKLLLETHVRDSCVKSPKQKQQRFSVNTRRSYIAPPPKYSSRRSAVPNNVVVKEKLVKLAVAPNIKCDKCEATFTTHTNLLKHKVISHGHETPDKSVGKSSRKSSVCSHSGVPASEKFKNAFAALKRKLEN